MSFRISKYHDTEFNDINGTNVWSMETLVYCDTLSDLPTPDEINNHHLTIGCKAIIVANGDKYYLNSSGTWIKDSSGGGGGGTSDVQIISKTTQEWSALEGNTSVKDTIYVYTDKIVSGSDTSPAIKIGDGTTTIGNLEFIGDPGASGAVTDVSYNTSTRTLSQTIDGQSTAILTVDDTPTNGSNNPVTSDAVYDALAGKVDKVNGKQLSTEDFTTAEKTKLDALASGITPGEKDIYGIAFNSYGQITDAEKVASLDLTFTVSGFDGTPERYLALMKEFFSAYDVDSMTPQELTTLVNQWYASTRDDWNGWTTFDDTGVSTGTKGGDNTGLICVPSTDTEANTDDYWGLPLFYPIDVNFICDANGETLVTQIDGITTGFERDNPDKFVGVMQMSGYHWQSHTETTFTDGYSAQPQTGKDFCDLMPEANGNQFMVHTKYAGTIVDGKLRSYSGAIPTCWLSAEDGNTYSKANGSQYGSESITQLSFLTIMTRIKYASLTQDGINQGCVDYNVQRPVSAATTNKQYVLMSESNANQFFVGSSVLIGTATSTSAPDRGNAYSISISGQAGTLITKITADPDGSANKAVWFENLAAFSATGSGSYASGVTVVSSFAWQSGINDSVKGNDGSIKRGNFGPSSGKFPAKIQGVEYGVGAYEAYGDTIIQVNPPATGYTNGFVKYYVCKDTSKRTNSITADYTDLGITLSRTASTTNWYYISKMTFSNGICAASALGGSSTTYERDAVYFEVNVGSVQVRAFRPFGSLVSGSASAGLSCFPSTSALSYRSWASAVRLSAAASWGRS